MGTDFFITYNGKDHQWAAWLAATLEAAGYTTFSQVWDFRPGDNFMVNMNHGLANARHTIGVLSPNYIASTFARAEWTAAYRDAIMGKDRAFIPVLVEECQIPPLLGPVAYVDLVDVDEAQARTRLLAGVATNASRPTTAPPFPGGQRS